MPYSGTRVPDFSRVIASLILKNSAINFTRKHPENNNGKVELMVKLGLIQP
jgi:hypothetical protein